MDFNNEILGKLSVIQEDDGTLWFIGNQVTKMLGHSNPKRALQDIPHDWKRVIKYDKFNSEIVDKFAVPSEGTTNSKVRKLTIITEGALYYLVSRGQTELSKYFNQWLFGEVVPTIRKQGLYIKEDLLRDNKRLREKLAAYRNEVAVKAITIAELKAERDNRDLYGDSDYCTDEEIEFLCHYKK